MYIKTVLEFQALNSVCTFGGIILVTMGSAYFVSHSFIDKYLLHAYYVPSTILDAEDT